MSGSEPVEVALALLVREGRLLVTRRAAGSHLGGYWEFPGGKLLPGETPAAAAVREVAEETGLGCRALRTLSAIEYVYPERAVRLFPVICLGDAGEPRLKGPTDYRWLRPEELDAAAFPPANLGLIRQLQAGLEGMPG